MDMVSTIETGIRQGEGPRRGKEAEALCLIDWIDQVLFPDECAFESFGASEIQYP